MQVALDDDEQAMTYGIPVEEAFDSDADPNNLDSPWLLEPYYYVDHAAEVVALAQARLRKSGGDEALEHKRFGVRKVPREPRPAVGD